MTVCDVIHTLNTVLQNCGGKEDMNIQSCFDVIVTKCQGPWDLVRPKSIWNLFKMQVLKNTDQNPFTEICYQWIVYIGVHRWQWITDKWTLNPWLLGHSHQVTGKVRWVKGGIVDILISLNESRFVFDRWLLCQALLGNHSWQIWPLADMGVSGQYEPKNIPKDCTYLYVRFFQLKTGSMCFFFSRFNMKSGVSQHVWAKNSHTSSWFWFENTQSLSWTNLESIVSVEGQKHHPSPSLPVETSRKATLRDCSPVRHQTRWCWRPAVHKCFRWHKLVILKKKGLKSILDRTGIS